MENTIKFIRYSSLIKMRSVLILLIWGASCILSEKIKYDDYKLFRLHPATQQHNDLLSNLQLQNENVDFWSRTNIIGLPVDVMVAPIYQREFIELLASNKIPNEVIVEDVQNVLEAEMNTRRASNMSWTEYHDLETIYAWMDNLGAAYSEAEVLSVGSSYYDREIKGVKISYGPGKRGVFIESGIHAREWIAPATATYLINELLTSSDPRLRRIARSFDWHIFPVVNPDGYVYSFTTDRLWRKNRTPYQPCVGTDGNRNWDFLWGQVNVENSTCSLTYPGPSVFSEVEIAALKDYIVSIASTLDAFFALHSYSQFFLVPYANTTQQLGNYDDLIQIAKKGIDAVSVRYGTKYITGSSAEILYLSSGTSRDWIKDKFDVPLVYTIELRDNGTYKFLLPPDQIIPNNEEIVDGLMAMFEEGENLGYFTLG